MLSVLGVMLNIIALIYLGFQTASCLGPEQIEGINTFQNPYIISFIGIIALFIAQKN
ncbi:MAG TPA: hypothetical protein PLT45_03995 [Smithella sp.]|nr:hypothetical protein [Smithella sp.]